MKKAEFRRAVLRLHSPAEGWVAYFNHHSRGDVEASIQLPASAAMASRQHKQNGYESCRTRWYLIYVTPRPELRETHVQVDEFTPHTKEKVEEINPDYALQSRGEAFDYAEMWLSKAKGIRNGNIIA